MRFLVGSLLGLLLVPGCSLSSGKDPAGSWSKTYFQEYSSRIQQNLKSLEKLDSRQGTNLLLAAETRRECREGARSFLDTLAEYRRLLEELKTKWETTKASDVRAALTGSNELHERLQKHALALTSLSDSVEREFLDLKDSEAPD